MSLSHTQSSVLKRIMDNRTEELLEHIRNTLPKPADETTLERTGVAQDEVDDATTSAEEHLNYTMHRHYVGELQLIDAARERIEKGLLDCCVDCDGEIGYARLQAQPYAVRCTDCQERYERRAATQRR